MQWIEFNNRFFCLNQIVKFTIYKEENQETYGVDIYYSFGFPASRYERIGSMHAYDRLIEGVSREEARQIVRDIILGRFDVTHSVMNNDEESVYQFVDRLAKDDNK